MFNIDHNTCYVTVHSAIGEEPGEIVLRGVALDEALAFARKTLAAAAVNDDKRVVVTVCELADGPIVELSHRGEVWS